MNFSEVIDLLRDKQGFSSHEQAADYVGLSRGGYFKMLNGTHEPKDSTIHKIMDGTGLEAPVIEAAWKAEFARDAKVRKSWVNFLGRVAALALVAPIAWIAENFQHYILC